MLKRSRARLAPGFRNGHGSGQQAVSSVDSSTPGRYYTTELPCFRCCVIDKRIPKSSPEEREANRLEAARKIDALRRARGWA